MLTLGIACLAASQDGTPLAPFNGQPASSVTAAVQSTLQTGWEVSGNVMASERLTRGAESVRVVAFSLVLHHDGQRCATLSTVRTVAADGREPVDFSAARTDPDDAANARNYKWTGVVQPREGLTWGGVTQSSDIATTMSLE